MSSGASSSIPAGTARAPVTPVFGVLKSRPGGTRCAATSATSTVSSISALAGAATGDDHTIEIDIGLKEDYGKGCSAGLSGTAALAAAASGTTSAPGPAIILPSFAVID